MLLAKFQLSLPQLFELVDGIFRDDKLQDTNHLDFFLDPTDLGQSLIQISRLNLNMPGEVCQKSDYRKEIHKMLMFHPLLILISSDFL